MLSRRFGLLLLLTAVVSVVIVNLPDGNFHNKALQLVFSLAGLGYLWLAQRRMKAVRPETQNLLYMRELAQNLDLKERNRTKSDNRIMTIINEATIGSAVGVTLLLRAAINWLELPNPSFWLFVVVSSLVGTIVFFVLFFVQQRIEDTWKPPALTSSLPRVFFDTDHLPTPRQSHKN